MSGQGAPPIPEGIDPNENHGTWLLALFWTEVAVSVVFVALRFWVRVARRALGADDWFMLLTLIMFTITLAFSSVMIHYGLGRHIFTVPPQNVSKVIMWNAIAQAPGALLLPCGKISVTLLLMRLMGPQTKWRKWFLIVNNILFLILCIVAVALVFAQCSPSSALWAPDPTKCWDPNIAAHFAIAVSSYSAALDFVLALLPVTIIWGLQMNKRGKIGLLVLLGLGTFTGVCAAVKAYQQRLLATRVDLTYEITPLYAWSASEAFLNVVFGSIPTLKPLYQWLFTGKPMSNYGTGERGQSHLLRPWKSLSGKGSRQGSVPGTAQDSSVDLVVPGKAMSNTSVSHA